MARWPGVFWMFCHFEPPLPVWHFSQIESGTSACFATASGRVVA